MKVPQLFDLSGKVAVVTGGSRGIGYQIARGLAEAGARVVMTARKEADLAEAAANLKAEGHGVIPVQCDISQIDSLQGVVDSVLSQTGHIDILVNNAGTSWGAPTEEYPLRGWRKVIETNLTGLFYMTLAVGNHMIARRKGGRIINLSSVAGQRGSHPAIMQAVAYNASKGGVDALTRDLAVKWARHGITVNAIAPSFFPTKMSQIVIAMNEEKILEAIPMGRLGGDDELKGVVAFFASDASSYVTGQVLAVDGGVTAL